MSADVKKFHEEEAIGKTYDFQIARRLLRYLRPYMRLLVPALILTLMLNLLGILQPKFTQYAIDWYILPRHTQGVTLFALIYLGAQFARFVFSYFQVVLLNTIGQYVMFDLRGEIYDKLQHQEIAYYDSNPVGRIMTRLTADVDALNELFTSGVTDLLGDLVMIAGIIGVMAWSSSFNTPDFSFSRSGTSLTNTTCCKARWSLHIESSRPSICRSRLPRRRTLLNAAAPKATSSSKTSGSHIKRASGS